MTARTLASSSKTTELPMLLHGGAHPVDLGVAGDGGVVDVDHDHLVVLVGRILANPVRVKNPESLESTSNPLLSNRLEIPLRLLLVDRTGGLGLTIGATLGDWALTSAPH